MCTITLRLQCLCYSETTKHTNFVSEPMGDKLVKQVPGVGDVIATHMNKGGLAHAYELYGHYLCKKKEEFEEFVRGFGANAHQIEQVVNAFSAWKAQYQ